MSVKLRTQVIGLGVGTALLVVVLAAIPLAVLLRNDAYSSALQRATVAAQSAADYVSSGAYDAASLKAYVNRLNGREEHGGQVTVQLGNGTSVGASLPQAVLDVADGERPPPMGGDHDHDNGLGHVSAAQVSNAPGGRLVQVFCETPSGNARVLALVTDGTVSSTVRERYAVVGGASVVLLLLALLASELLGRRLTRPLQRTAATAVALSGGDLDARAPVSGSQEVASVAIELNALADRIVQLLAQERENAADLSHRLRTPLTALRLAAENISDAEDRASVEEHVDQMQRTLTGVIRAARRGGRDGLHPRCDAAEVVRSRADFWKPLAEDQERTLALVVPDVAAWVPVNADDLSAALDALIENVIAHTPEATGFRIGLAYAPAGVVIDVVDDGPGIPASLVVRGQSDRGSTGLGLDIARSVAENAGGRLSIVPGSGGHVRLELPADAQRVPEV